MASDRPISIVGQIYSSIKEAARDLGVDPRALKVRLDSTAPEWGDWLYLERTPAEFCKYKIPCTYTVTHVPSGSFYVGSTKDGMQRKHFHVSKLKAGTHVCKKLQELWNLDPNELNWKWVFYLQHTREDALKAEQEYMDQHRGNPLMLNSVTDARSAISEVMKREDFRNAMREKTKTLTPEQRLAWGERSRRTAILRWSDPEKRAKFMGSNNPSAKGVVIDGVVYGSIKQASESTNVSPKTIWSRVRNPDYPNYTFNVPVQ